MSEGGIVIELTLDKSQFEAELAAAELSVEGLKNALNGIGEAFDMANVVGNLQSVTDAATGIGETMGTLKDTLSGGADFATGFEAVGTALQGILEHANTAVDAVGNLGNTFLSILGTGGLVESIKNIGTSFVEVGKNIRDVVTQSAGFNVLREAVGNSRTAFKEAGDACRELGSKILESITQSKGFEAVQGFMGKVGDAIKTAAGKVLEFGKNMISAIAQSSAAQNIGAFFQTIGSAIGDAVTKVIDFGKNMINTIKDSQAMQAVSAAIKKVGDAIKNSAVMTKMWDAAQKIFSATLGACPIWLLVTIIAAVVAGIVALCAWLSKGSEENQKYKERIEEMTTAQEEFTEAVAETAKKHEEKVKETQAQAMAGGKLVDQLNAMVDAEGRMIVKDGDAEASKKALLNTIDMLNKVYPGLNLLYDEEAGKLNLNTDKVRELTAAKDELAMAQVYQDRYIALLTEEAVALENIAAAEQMLIDLESADMNGVAKNNRRKELNDIIADNNELLDENAIKQQYNTDQWMALDTLAADTIISNDERMRTSKGETVEQMAEQYGVAAEKIHAYLQDESNNLDGWIEQHEAAMQQAGEGTNVLVDSFGNSFAEVAGAYEGMGGAATTTAETVATAAGSINEGLNSIDSAQAEEALAGLAEKAPEAMAGVGTAVAESAALEEGASGMIERMTNTIVEGMANPAHAEAATQMVAGMGEAVESSTAVEDALNSILDNALNTARIRAMAHEWYQLGLSIAEGMARGVRAGYGVLASAVTTIITNALSAGQRTAVVNSPSKLFAMGLGMPISEGIAYGIEQGTPMVESSLSKQLRALAHGNGNLGRMASIAANITQNIGNRQGVINAGVMTQQAGLAQQNALQREQLRATQALLNKDWGVSVDGRQLALATNRANANLGYRVAKGPLADVY